MSRKSFSVITSLVLILVLLPGLLQAQVKQADYERAANLREKFQSLALNVVDRSGWIGKTPRFWYRKSVEGGHEYFVVDAEALSKKTAFDHDRLAASLAKLLKDEVDPKRLPFRAIQFALKEKAIRFDVGESKYECDLTSYVCKKIGEATRRRRRDPFTMWERGPAPEAESSETKSSPDRKWEVYIKNYNIYVRSKETNDEFVLSSDGSEGNYYTFASIRWSPDSKKLVAFRLKRGYHRIIHYVESSPTDQLQPKHQQMEYAKPGDALDIDQPVLFHIDSKKQMDIDNTLFPNPYDMTKHGERLGLGQREYQLVEVLSPTKTMKMKPPKQQFERAPSFY